MERPSKSNPDTNASRGFTGKPEGSYRAPASKPDPYAVDNSAAPPAPGGPPPAASMRTGDPTFDVQEDRGIHVVTLLRSQILDAREIETLGTNLRGYFANKQRAKVVLDMTAVHHLSSAALGMLVMLKSTIEGGAGKFRLAGVREDLQKVFTITKLDKVLTIKENVTAAKASL